MSKGAKKGTKRVSARDFKALADELPLAVIETTRDLQISYMNQYALDLLKVEEPSAYRKKSLKSFVSKAHKADLEGAVKTISKETPSKAISIQLLRSDGLEIQSELRITSHGPAGKSGRLRIYAADASLTSHVGPEFKFNDAILREILTDSHEALVIVGDDFKFEYVNDEAARLFGGTREDLIGHDFREIMQPPDANFVAERYQQRRKGTPVPDRYPFRISTIGGQPVDVEVRVAIAKGLDGRTKTIVHILDMTDRRKEQRALVETAARYEVLVETMNDGLAIDDQNGSIVYCNEAFASMLGHPLDKLVGKPWVDFTRSKNLDWVQEKIDERRTGATGKYELEWVNKNGDVVPTIVSAAPYFNQDGEFVGTFAVITEISAQKEAEDTIAMLLDLLTHDIANQLQVITTSTGLLDPEIPRSYLQEAQGDILDAVERCNRLITKVKRAGQLRRLPIGKINLTSILDEKVSVLSRVYGATVFVEDIEPVVYVKADALLGELLWNLLENAARHNPKEDKRVWVSGSREDGFFKLAVSDDGPGISKNRKDAIFDRRQHSGGVGLTLVAQMARKYGGTVEVRDRVKGKPSHGAKFILSLREVME
ncbi:MAG: PAS domain S-box protein [Promethearchaeota archaeon]